MIASCTDLEKRLAEDLDAQPLSKCLGMTSAGGREG